MLVITQPSRKDLTSHTQGSEARDAVHPLGLRSFLLGVPSANPGILRPGWGGGWGGRGFSDAASDAVPNNKASIRVRMIRFKIQ